MHFIARKKEESFARRKRPKRKFFEPDGNQHLEKKAIEYDKIRDDFFRGRGIRVLRIPNSNVSQNLKIVYQKIISSLRTLSPEPSPR